MALAGHCTTRRACRGALSRRTAGINRGDLWYAVLQPRDELGLKFRKEKDVGERLMDFKRGIPVGRAPVVDIRNEHATYAVIW